MDHLNYKEQIPPGFAGDSRVWIYQSDRPFNNGEALQIQNMLVDFVTGWNSHGVRVKGTAFILFDQFIILMADETATGVSGCSTDSSVRLMKSIEKKFNVQLFDRQHLAFVVNDKIELIPLDRLEQHGDINGDTLYFNNTVLSRQDMLDKWLIPVSKSWLAKRFEGLSF